MMVQIIELLDGFLVAGVLMIFAFSLYELYISRLEPAQLNPAKGDDTQHTGYRHTDRVGWVRS